MRVTAEVKQATEKGLRTAARKLFARNGLDGTSTREIAAMAGVAVGTLFNYFASKEALALALVAEGFDAGRRAGRSRVGLDQATPASSDAPPSGLAREPAEPRRRELEEDLFALIAADLRELASVRRLVGEVIEPCLSPHAEQARGDDAGRIRTERLDDVRSLLTLRGIESHANASTMHLYWSLYLAVLSFWAKDESPSQHDTLAVLDQATRMFAAGVLSTRPSFTESSLEALP